MGRSPLLVRALAAAFLQGPWSKEGLDASARRVIAGGKSATWLARVVADVAACFGDRPPPPPRRRLEEFLAWRPEVRLRLAKFAQGRPNLVALPVPRAMQPAPALARLVGLPSILTTGKLAEWLEVAPRELTWLADPWGRERHAPEGPLRHYRYRLLPKRSGRLRVLEAPKPRLKSLQRQILREILDRVPPHAAAHAYCPGRSVATYVAPHAGREVALHIDLGEFFPSLGARRVAATIRYLGYPESVACMLAALCTNVTPADVLATAEVRRIDRASRALYEQPHVPQGAPTSPALANLCAYRLDARLSGLARRFGAEYTRYADDLLFSGDREFARGLTCFRILVGAIAMSEGFFIRARKTRVLWRHACQRAAGVVFNAHPNFPRVEFDRLKATLCNAIRHGPASQNLAGHEAFREHLQGRISYVRMLNPRRGEKLRALYDRIDWSR